MGLSRGHQLALDQLHDIARQSNGALTIAGEPTSSESGLLMIQLSLATKAYRRTGGMQLRDRERLRVYVPDRFPFSAPRLAFDSPRYHGAPHVNWGCWICLYLAPDIEWQPADAMFGFMKRVDAWFAASGSGDLNSDDAPLHPPANYTDGQATVVVRTDTPVNIDDEYWLGYALLQEKGPDRLDLIGWSNFTGSRPEAKPDIQHAVAILLSKPLPFEYPSKVWDLLEVVEHTGVSFITLCTLLNLAALSTNPGKCAYLVLGAPMRRRAAGEPIRQHVTVWEIDANAVPQLRDFAVEESSQADRRKMLEWMTLTSVAWCYTMEDRPELVYRRDQNSLMSPVQGMRVVVLGCGALGSVIAEHLLRAGARMLFLADKGYVHPGILVRQRYADSDIGRPKALALAEKLEALGFACSIQAQQVDLKTGVLTLISESAPDLVIDATASTVVAHQLEVELADGSLDCPLVSVTVSARAEHGCVIVRMPGCGGGLIRLARQAKLAAFEKDAQQPLVKAFWPGKDSVPLFQPEPGCSEPTFTGSAADIDHLAAGLLNIGIHRTSSLDSNRASMDLIAASWLEPVKQTKHRIACDLSELQVLREHCHGYTTLFSERAAREISAEVRRNARVNSSRDETGGLMFGEIDDSHRVIWIDSVTGPPSDSTASAQRFVCGVQGMKPVAEHKRKASGDSSRFIGIWHTHPVSEGRPSTVDLTAMANLLVAQPETPRHTVMLIVGFAEACQSHEVYLFRRSEIMDAVSSIENSVVAGNGMSDGE